MTKYRILHIPTNSLVYKGTFKGYTWYGLDDDSLNEHIRYSASKSYYKPHICNIVSHSRRRRKEIINEIIGDMFIYGFSSTYCEYEFIEVA